MFLYYLQMYILFLVTCPVEGRSCLGESYAWALRKLREGQRSFRGCSEGKEINQVTAQEAVLKEVQLGKEHRDVVPGRKFSESFDNMKPGSDL